MAMLSIPSYKTNDPNYRYKMPRLVAKVEGRGNGIKTNIVNMGEIARALKRPPDYPTKFCGTELGTQSKFDPAEGKAIVNGAHEQKDLQVLIDKFIEKFVLCENCHLPEIDLIIRKGRVQYQCNACGKKGEIDNGHKLSTFILKNPPGGADSTMGSNASKKTYPTGKKERLSVKKTDQDEETLTKKKSHQKKKKSTATEKQNNESEEEISGTCQPGLTQDESQKCFFSSGSTESEKLGKYDDSGEGAISEVEECNSINDEKKNKNALKSKKNKKGGNKVVMQKLDELNYSSDETQQLIHHLLSYLCKKESSDAEEKKKSTNEDKNSPDYEGEDEDEMNNEWENDEKCVSTSAVSINPSITPELFYEQLRLLQMSQGIDHVLKFYVALKVLFHDSLSGLTPTTLESRFAYLKPIAFHTPAKDILVALQDFVYINQKRVVLQESSGYAAILFIFYDHDLLSGDEIKKFYQKRRKRDENKYHNDAEEAYQQARDAAQPILRWLDEEDKEDQDDDKQGNNEENRKEYQLSDSKQNNNDSDIDIDAL